MSVTVLLADDSVVMRKAIVDLLKLAPDIRVLAEGSSFAQTIELACKLHPQITLLDIHMDGEDSVTPELLKSSLAGSCLLAMSIWNDDKTKSLAKTIGADELLDKAALGIELIPAIRKYAHLQYGDNASDQLVQPTF